MTKCYYCNRAEATEFFRNHELRLTISICFECMVNSKIASSNNEYWKISKEKALEGLGK